jgi:hypothetical protein
MPAHFHAMSFGEPHNLVGMREVERGAVRPDHPPLHRFFRFEHVEFARQGQGIQALRKQRGRTAVPIETPTMSALSRRFCVSREALKRSNNSRVRNEYTGIGSMGACNQGRRPTVFSQGKSSQGDVMERAGRLLDT